MTAEELVLQAAAAVSYLALQRLHLRLCLCLRLRSAARRAVAILAARALAADQLLLASDGGLAAAVLGAAALRLEGLKVAAVAAAAGARISTFSPCAAGGCSTSVLYCWPS